MGLVMSGTTFGFMIGPTLGGWLYQTGGPRLPFLAVAALAAVAAVGFICVRLPRRSEEHVAVPLRAIVQVPAVAACAAAVIVGGGTIAMLEPVLALYLASALGMGPARIGMVIGSGAVVTAALHPLAGRLADRFGPRRVTLAGLIAMALALPLQTLMWNFASAVALYGLGTIAIAMVATPSLAYMASAMSTLGVRSFGVAYGLYNFAWAIGLLAGPAIGGFAYERMGFTALTLVWAPVVVAITVLIAVSSRPAPAARAV
jgi:predicted MFS family arabinose efflux permease